MPTRNEPNEPERHGPRPLGLVPPAQAGLVAPHLQAWRLHRGLTSVQLAAQAGLGFPTVSRGENGRPLKMHTLRKIARVLDCPIGSLLAVAPPPPPPGTPLVLRTRTRARVPYCAAPRRRAQLDDPEYLA